MKRHRSGEEGNPQIHIFAVVDFQIDVSTSSMFRFSDRCFAQIGSATMYLSKVVVYLLRFSIFPPPTKNPITFRFCFFFSVGSSLGNKGFKIEGFSRRVFQIEEISNRSGDRVDNSDEGFSDLRFSRSTALTA